MPPSPEHPCVVLLTDFGHAAPYVGQMKGVLKRLLPSVAWIDLYHEVPPYAIQAGAWLLGRLRPHMPPDAAWLCVVDRTTACSAPF